MVSVPLLREYLHEKTFEGWKRFPPPAQVLVQRVQRNVETRAKLGSGKLMRGPIVLQGLGEFFLHGLSGLPESYSRLPHCSTKARAMPGSVRERSFQRLGPGDAK